MISCVPQLLIWLKDHHLARYLAETASITSFLSLTLPLPHHLPLSIQRLAARNSRDTNFRAQDYKLLLCAGTIELPETLPRDNSALL